MNIKLINLFVLILLLKSNFFVTCNEAQASIPKDLNEVVEEYEKFVKNIGNTFIRGPKEKSYPGKLANNFLVFFNKLNDQAFKDKVASDVQYRKVLINKGLYPKKSESIQDQKQAKKIFEDTIQQIFTTYVDSIEKDIKLGFNYYKGQDLIDYINELIVILPIEFGGIKINLSQFFPGDDAQQKSLLNTGIISSILEFGSPELLIKFLVLSDSLNKFVKIVYNNFRDNPLLIVAQMYDYKEQDGPSIYSNKVDKKKLLETIKALLENGADVNLKNGFGINFLDYINEEDKGGNLIRPEINKIYKEYKECKNSLLSAPNLTGLPKELVEIISKFDS